LKGLREGDAAVSEQHALVLVNLGSASGKNIVTLARRIQSSVADRFGLMLEPEPRLIEFDT
jgi:UDP-N-acetylmuramate dehydrogenase